MSRKRLWFDFSNVPHVHFLKPIIEYLTRKGYDGVYSLRDFLETEALFQNLIGKPYIMVGSHKGSNRLKKVVGVIERTINMYRSIPEYDLKISIGGDSSEYISFIRGKPSITFDDNELAPNWIYSRIPIYSFWTSAVPIATLIKQGFRPERLYRYDGYKEDIYIADYKTDKSFLSKIPYSNYVLLRSENVNANYVKNSSEYLFPIILELLTKRGINVIVLPRNPIDKILAGNYKNVYIPEKPINGLDACFYADAVITGAGTLAREAACLGTPAFSFFAGKELMSVDKAMIKNSWLYHSRDADDIVKSVLKSKKRHADRNRSKNVQREVLLKLESVLMQNI